MNLTINDLKEQLMDLKKMYQTECELNQKLLLLLESKTRQLEVCLAETTKNQGKK